ncbi:hypothetical protein [Arsenicibacter rosenii]|uniref:Uncharacterized protein n=1 Tax=Arsenicibacter rosenii TaxID=1750698 RepID=A0A1S2VGY5_9BACT|nr:hypothetical protein [Arsenicibacter rosenii]OIN57148.1 hypothetical protein BLX24_21600 [Arsenicibacter rosenii]
MKFDPTQLADESLRRLYEYQIIRVNEIYSSFVNHYLPQKTQRTHVFDYFVDTNLNASTGTRLGKDYIRVSSPTIYLLRSFFDHLLADDRFLSEISPSTVQIDIGTTRTPNLIIDPEDVTKVREGNLSTDQNRLLFSTTMADLCMTFISCHEVGHIVYGHTRYTRLFFKEDCLNFFDFWKRPKRIDINHAMEYDADLLAATLIVQYLEDVYRAAFKYARHAEVYAGLIKKGKLLEDITIFCILFIYALFVYLSNGAPDQDSTHPQPLVRALYIKDVMLAQMGRRHPNLDMAYLLDAMPRYWDEFDQQLGQLGFYQPESVLEKITELIDEKNNVLGKKASTIRPLWQKYSWIPSDDWS